MVIDFNDLSATARYHVITQTVLPRPIAWVLSINEDGTTNLAPFSYFTAICSDPPLVVLSIGKKRDGWLKDTRKNIASGRPFVIHIAGVDQAEHLNQSAAEMDYGDSEVLASNLPLAEFPGCDVPRLAACQVAFHCSLFDIHEIGPKKQGVIYAEIKQVYLADTIAEQTEGRYKIDAERINPLARLGGTNYAGLGRYFSLDRPK